MVKDRYQVLRYTLAVGNPLMGCWLRRSQC